MPSLEEVILLARRTDHNRRVQFAQLQANKHRDPREVTDCGAEGSGPRAQGCDQCANNDQREHESLVSITAFYTLSQPPFSHFS